MLSALRPQAARPALAPPAADAGRAGAASKPAYPPQQRRAALQQRGTGSSRGGASSIPASSDAELIKQTKSAASCEQVVQQLQQAAQLWDAHKVSAAANRMATLHERQSDSGDRNRAAFQQLARIASGLQLDAWALAQLVWAAAKLWDSVEPKQAFGAEQAVWQQRLAEAFRDVDCKPQSVSNCLWGASKLGWQLEGGLAAAADAAIQRTAVEMNSQNLGNTLLACGMLRWSPGAGTLAAAVTAMQPLLASGTPKPQELCNFLWGLAELQEQGAGLPPSVPALCTAAVDWASRRWDQLPALSVVELCFSLARLGHRPSSAWIGCATERCMDRISDSGVGFADFILACSKWRHSLQPHELERLVPAVVDNICADWPEPGRGGALRLAEALNRQMGELPYLAAWAAHLVGVGLRLPAQQLEALRSYVGQHGQQLSKGYRQQVQRAFEAWAPG